MNRRDAIAKVPLLALAAMVPGTNKVTSLIPETNIGETKEVELSDPKNDSRVHLTTVSVIDDDPDVEQIRITVLLKQGKTTSGADSFIVERELLKHVGTNLIPWFQHCRNTGMKTL